MSRSIDPRIFDDALRIEGYGSQIVIPHLGFAPKQQSISVGRLVLREYRNEYPLQSQGLSKRSVTGNLKNASWPSEREGH